MLTTGADEVDAAGLWMTISDLARARGVSKQAASKRVERFEAQKLIETRIGPRGTKLVNVAQFDRAAGEATDAVRELNGKGSNAEPEPSRDPVLAKEQARRAAYDADLKKLDLDERLGKLLPIDEVEAAMVRCAEALAQAINQLPSRADDLAAAVAKEGTTGARAFLRALSRDLLAKLAKEMRLLEGEGQAEQDEVQA